MKFNADKSETLPWTFSPSQRYVSVLPGESSLAFYTAKNKSDEDIVGIATYNVAPDKVSFLSVLPSCASFFMHSPISSLFLSLSTDTR